jgi:hypothetical protein
MKWVNNRAEVGSFFDGMRCGSDNAIGRAVVVIGAIEKKWHSGINRTCSKGNKGLSDAYGHTGHVVHCLTPVFGHWSRVLGMIATTYFWRCVSLTGDKMRSCLPFIRSRLALKVEGTDDDREAMKSGRMEVNYVADGRSRAAEVPLRDPYYEARNETRGITPLTSNILHKSPTYGASGL